MGITITRKNLPESAGDTVKKLLGEGARTISDADRKRVEKLLLEEGGKTISDADRKRVKKLLGATGKAHGGMIHPRPGRATVDSMRTLARNPRAALSPRDDQRVANYLTQNIRPQPFNAGDVSIQDYIRRNDGGMVRKTRTF